MGSGYVIVVDSGKMGLGDIIVVDSEKAGLEDVIVASSRKRDWMTSLSIRRKRDLLRSSFSLQRK